MRGRLQRAAVLAGSLMLFAGMIPSSVAASTELRLPRIFGNNMVLQQGPGTPVWGWAAPGQKVIVTVAGQTKSAVAGKDGKWMVTLTNLKQSSVPVTMTVQGKETKTFENVLIGDVWLGSGQSNMEWATRDVIDAQKFMDQAENNNIRLFIVQHANKGMKQEDVAGQWVVCNKNTVRDFSAVLYFFGKEINEKTNVPLGLLETNWGGTNIEAWTPEIGYATTPALKDMYDMIKRTDADFAKTLPAKLDAVQTWLDATKVALNAGKAVTVTPEWPEPPLYDRWCTVLYNGMIHPLIPFGIKGAIWYQGEANGGENEIYRIKMETMISSWRKLWGRGDFPFYFVQLANWLPPTDNPGDAGGWAPTREAQLKALGIPNTGMAVAIDIGDTDDIHPKNKQDVGHRLAVWALNNDYGMKDVLVSGPLYKSMVVDGDKIRISFDYVGEGLMVGEKIGLEHTKEVPNGTLKKFAIAGEDRQWRWADAKIVGKEVVVSSPDVPKPVAVRYAYSMNPLGCNLYNKEGFPASPFRTDNW